jgi:hypothetical protein
VIHRAAAGLAAATGVCLLAGCQTLPMPRSSSSRSTPTSTATPSPGQSATPGVHFEVLSGSSKAPGQAYSYHVEYPQLDGLSVGLRNQLNGSIRGTIERALSEFLRAARDAQSADQSSGFTCTGAVVRLTQRLASARVDCGIYIAGAAHPNPATYTFDCDLRLGRVLALADLFRPGTDYLRFLSDRSRPLLRSQLVPLGAWDEAQVSAGTAPEDKNFKTFLLEPYTLRLVFEKYQVAAGALGPREVAVTYGDLDQYFAPLTRELITVAQ